MIIYSCSVNIKKRKALECRARVFYAIPFQCFSLFLLVNYFYWLGENYGSKGGVQVNRFVVILLFLVFVLGSGNQAYALTFDTLPKVQKSNQWSVQVGEAKQGKGLVKPEKGKFHTYSLKIDKIGTDVLTTEVYMYRNEPNSKTKYALFGCPDEKDCKQDRYELSISFAEQLNRGAPYEHANFLLAEKATELEVEIVWTEKESSGRPLKETFLFTQE